MLSVLSRKCCHGNNKGSILELLLLNKFLYIFRKSHQIWLNYISHSLSYRQKTSRAMPNTPPPRGGGGGGKDMVKRVYFYLTHPVLFLILTNMGTHYSKRFCNRIRQDGTILPTNSKIETALLFFTIFSSVKCKSFLTIFGSVKYKILRASWD